MEANVFPEQFEELEAIERPEYTKINDRLYPEQVRANGSVFIDVEEAVKCGDCYNTLMKLYATECWQCGKEICSQCIRYESDYLDSSDAFNQLPHCSGCMW